MTDIVVARQDLQTHLRQFAATLTTLRPDDIPVALEVVRQLESLGSEIGDRLRGMLIDRLKEFGVVETDKGTLRLDIGDKKVRAIPTRTGYDPKKVETALRRRGADPAAFMDTTLTFKVNTDKLKNSPLTEDDLKGCEYTLNYRVTIE